MPIDNGNPVNALNPPQAKNDFKVAVNKYEACKTEYEYSHNHKVTIDVRNGSGKKGLAKEVADYLKEQCYDTYYGNWENFNEFNTRIIIYNNNTININILATTILLESFFI